MRNYNIVQTPHAYSFAIGFYGMCVGENNESECVDYDMNFSSFRNIVDSVYEVDSKQSNNTFAWFKSDLYLTDLNHFDKLKCGKTYYFVIKPGLNQLKIPHLYVTNSGTTDSESRGRVSEICSNILPTPTPEENCCSRSSNILTTTGDNKGTETLNGVKAFMFEPNGLFCYDTLEFTYLPSRYNFKSDDDSIVGYITLIGNFRNKEVRYTTPSGICYSAIAETQNGFNILKRR